MSNSGFVFQPSPELLKRLEPMRDFVLLDAVHLGISGVLKSSNWLAYFQGHPGRLSRFAFVFEDWIPSYVTC